MSATNVHGCECQVCRMGNDVETIRQHYQINLFLSRLTEPQRRWYVGLLSQNEGGPSERELARMTGLDPKTIRRGRHEIEHGLLDLPSDRQRCPGGGRLAIEKKILR